MVGAPVYGQATEEEKHDPNAAQQTTDAAKAMPMGMMMESCKMMEHGLQQMHTRMGDMDSKLQGLLETMNASTGDSKITAIGAAVNEIAVQRLHMHQAQNEMHDK